MVTDNETSTLSGDGNSASKRSRNQEVDGTAVDRISGLPESLLLHILSFLSAIYVVRTSVLSRRWQYVWTAVPDLNFGDEINREVRDREKSMNFVNKFLFQYKATSIRKFRIESLLNDSHDTELWIRWAINRNVEELDISFPYSSPLHHLPQTIFGCKTLVALKLKDHRKVNMVFPPSACIPCLKTLELDSIMSPDDEFEKKLISCCGILENLYIKTAHYDPKKSICVYAQQLKRLKIKSYYGRNQNGVIDINAPALEDLDIEDNGSYSLLLANVGNLSKAKINLNGSNAFQSLLKCFSALKNVKSLHLSSGHPKKVCILRPGHTVHNVNLTCLTLQVGSVWVQLLPYFFRCFLNLEVLRLAEDSYVYNCGTERYEQDSYVYNYATKLCTDPKLLPRGLLSRLRVFVVENFNGTNDELGILKYILKNGKVLDLVRLQYLFSSQNAKEYTTRKGTKAREFEEKFIHCEEVRCEIEKKLQVAQTILDFPRASQKCRIKFLEWGTRS